MCNNSVQCIYSTMVCNGQTIGDYPGSTGYQPYFCLDGSDEGDFCPSPESVECAPDYWKCVDHSTCVYTGR